MLDVEGVVGAAFLPDDGYIDPTGLTQAFASGARNLGVRIYEHTCVTGIESSDRRVHAVRTDRGSIKCELLLNCAGLWADQIGTLFNVSIPVAALEHQYLITEKSDQIEPGLPTLRDPDKNFYMKAAAGALEFGGWEDGTVAVSQDTLSFNFSLSL